MNKRIRLGVLATVTSVTYFGGGVASGQEAERVTEVVVTGSRIVNRNVEATTPVTELSVEELLSTGATSVGDVLNDLPSIRGTYTSANSTRFIGTAGVNFLDLRGLGTERTLVLVNGRRHVSGTDASLQVDTNTIPVDLLERVDIITGGASSIYGSDAVAGVVNFVLKRDYEGLRLSAQTGISSESDNNTSFVSAVGGLNFADGRGNVAGSLEWGKEDAFQHDDRDTTRSRQQFVVTSADPAGQSSDATPDRTLIRDTRSLNLNEGGVFIPSFQVGAGTVPASLRTRASNGQPLIYLFNQDGSLAELDYGTDFRPLAASATGGNGTTLRRYGDLTPEIERLSFNLISRFEIAPAAELFGEAKFVQADTLSISSPSFNQGTATTVPAATGSGALVLGVDNPYLTTQARSLIVSRLQPGATTFNLNRNNLDIGTRGEDTSRKTIRIVGGVRGDITDHLNYEVSLNHGRLKVQTDVLGNRLERNIRLAVDAVRAADGTIVCRARTNGAGAIITTGDPVIDNCVTANVLGDGNVSDAARAYINTPSTFEATITQQVANGFVSYDTGSWFELPGGAPGVAVGFEYRKEQSESAYSNDVVSGRTFLNAIQPLDKEYSVKEAFVEVNIPILADMPFVHELTVNGAYRAADYSLENTSTVIAWNGGLQWAPVEDLRFRANLAQSVRAPTLGDLYQPLTQNFATVRDPCDVNNVSQGSSTRASNCAAAGIPADFQNTVARTQTIEIRSGGNDALFEEEARSFTIGAAIQPRWVPNLSLSVDYYEIEITDVIASVTAQQILDNCYDSASLTNIFCPLVFRDPATDLFFANGNGPIGGGVLQSTLNYASRKARGIDAEIDYSFEVENIGRFSARWLGTYVRQRDNFPFLDQPSRADQLVEELGDPKYSFNLDLGYRRDNFAFSYGMRWLETQYVDFIENVRWVTGFAPQNPDFADVSWTGSIMYHDVRASYTWKDSVNFYVGVDNISDELPPIGLTGTGAGSGIFSNKGRFFYGGVKWDFGKN